MRTLLVDNHDSYTYNVFHLLAGVSGEEPIVVDNDAVSWRALSRWDFDAIVLSPGPGTPRRWHDFCVCDDILRYSEIPVLGICLGHQGLGQLLDGDVRSAPEAMHGRLSRIFHEGDGLFEGIPQGFPVVRYHSLAITGMGPDGNVCAWADDGVVMGIEHRRRPMWGVQFHPESIATEHGARLVENFYGLAAAAQSAALVRATKRPRDSAPRAHPGAKARPPAPAPSCACARSPASPRPRRSSNGSSRAEEHAFWLDSADAPTRLAQSSYLGTSAGADRCVLEYDVDAGAASGSTAPAATTIERGSIFDVLDRELAKRAIERTGRACRPTCSAASSATSATSSRRTAARTNVHSSDVPDAVMMLANRLIAVDHVRHRTHLLAICRRRRGGAPSTGSTRPRRRCATSSPTRPRPSRPLSRPSASRATRHVTLPLRSRARAVPRRHRPQPGRTGRRRVLRGLPHRPDLDRRRARARSTSTATCAAATRPPSPPT